LQDDECIPTIPIFKLLLGRPSKTFFSAAGAFFGGIFFFLAWRVCDAENGRGKIKQYPVDGRGRRCRQNCRHRSIIFQKKTSHELCKKEENSGKPSLYGTLTAVISGGFRQDISQYGGFPAGGRCYYYKRGYLRTSGIPRSQLPKQRQAHLPCKKTR
jgi:hypothetical protein